MAFPMPLYPYFTEYTPVLPSFYYDVYSAEQRVKQICLELDKMREYCNRLAENGNEAAEHIGFLESKMTELHAEMGGLLALIDSLNAGGMSRNPVSGGYDRLYAVNKQMYDMLRVYAATWKQLKGLKTYADFKTDGHTYAEVDMFGNLYYGDGSVRAKFTPTAAIDYANPGFGGEADV